MSFARGDQCFGTRIDAARDMCAREFPAVHGGAGSSHAIVGCSGVSGTEVAPVLALTRTVYSVDALGVTTSHTYEPAFQPCTQEGVAWGAEAWGLLVLAMALGVIAGNQR